MLFPKIALKFIYKKEKNREEKNREEISKEEKKK